jgi:hypothetical protein
MNLVNISPVKADGTTVFTCVPLRNDNNLTTFQEDNLSVAVQMRGAISLALRPGTATQKRKFTQKTKLPYQPAPIDGITQPIKFGEVHVTIVMDDDATSTFIEDAVAISSNTLQEAMVKDIYTNGRSPV